jgi:hypothetical protein
MYAPDDFLYYSKGIYSPSESTKALSNHAILLVGYNDTDELGNGYWIVKNSWGTDWGENGFGRVAYGNIEKYGGMGVVNGTNLCEDNDGDGYYAGDYCFNVTDIDDNDPDVHANITCYEDSDCGLEGCADGVYKIFTCNNPETEESYCSLEEFDTDEDNDNYNIECDNDCDDNNPNRWQILQGYTDKDNDEYGIGSLFEVCSGEGLPFGYSTIFGDCNDNDGSIHPGAFEFCDNKDNNCNLLIDENFPDKGETCNVGIGACQRTGNYICSLNGLETICSVVAGQPGREICFNEIDDDCDGEIDEEDCGIKGDINDDGSTDISDVILALRMSIGLDVTIRGDIYTIPYPAWLNEKADVNNDKTVNIQDVILILRLSIGLDSSDKLTEEQIPSPIRIEMEKKGLTIDDINKIK